VILFFLIFNFFTHTHTVLLWCCVPVETMRRCALSLFIALCTVKSFCGAQIGEMPVDETIASLLCGSTVDYKFLIFEVSLRCELHCHAPSAFVLKQPLAQYGCSCFWCLNQGLNATTLNSLAVGAVSEPSLAYLPVQCQVSLLSMHFV
jgi:hypothetical protein